MRKQSKSALITRQELLNAARALFSEKGYEETSIQDIIQKADYSIGAFYGHFKSKQELAGELYCEAMLAMQERACTALRSAQDMDQLVEALMFGALLGRSDPVLSALQANVQFQGDIAVKILFGMAKYLNLLTAKLEDLFPSADAVIISNCANTLLVVQGSYGTAGTPVYFIRQSEDDLRQIFYYLIKMCNSPA